MALSTDSAAAGVPAFVEKEPLERYVAPDWPSLIGLSRNELAAVLGEIGVPPGQRKMRAGQLWHWLYMRGATGFGADPVRTATLSYDAVSLVAALIPG